MAFTLYDDARALAGIEKGEINSGNRGSLLPKYETAMYVLMNKECPSRSSEHDICASCTPERKMCELAGVEVSTEPEVEIDVRPSNLPRRCADLGEPTGLFQVNPTIS